MLFMMRHMNMFYFTRGSRNTHFSPFMTRWNIKCKNAKAT